jgi:hypothetical protein
MLIQNDSITYRSIFFYFSTKVIFKMLVKKPMEYNFTLTGDIPRL